VIQWKKEDAESNGSASENTSKRDGRQDVRTPVEEEEISTPYDGKNKWRKLKKGKRQPAKRGEKGKRKNGERVGA